jgi:hypothetical protein
MSTSHLFLYFRQRLQGPETELVRYDVIDVLKFLGSTNKKSALDEYYYSWQDGKLRGMCRVPAIISFEEHRIQARTNCPWAV